MIYESQSPDETALVVGAKSNGSILQNRTKGSTVLEFFGKVETHPTLCVLDFNSTRKRMSVIIKGDDGYRLYCKGADNVIEERLAKDPGLNDPGLLKMTADRLNEFSEVGLRTLMVAWTPLTESQYNQFRQTLDNAENSLENREELVMQAYESVEKELRFLGCTAIEDRLQDDLPDTIEYLLQVFKSSSGFSCIGSNQDLAANRGQDRNGHQYWHVQSADQFSNASHGTQCQR